MLPVSGAIAGTAYYIDCSAGSDGTGTYASPWNSIDRNDMEALKEELGDLLLQIVLQVQIATEEPPHYVGVAAVVQLTVDGLDADPEPKCTIVGNDLKPISKPPGGRGGETVPPNSTVSGPVPGVPTGRE